MNYVVMTSIQQKKQLKRIRDVTNFSHKLDKNDSLTIEFLWNFSQNIDAF